MLFDVGGYLWILSAIGTVNADLCQAERVTVPANSSRLEPHAKAEGFEATSGMENTFESPGFRYQPIHAKGAAASLSTVAMNVRLGSFNSLSHPVIFPAEFLGRLNGHGSTFPLVERVVF